MNELEKVLVVKNAIQNSEDGLLEGEYLKNGITFYEDLLYLFSINKIQKIDLYNLYVDRGSKFLRSTFFG